MTKRFYKDAVTSPSDRDFWGVELDGKPVKTPTGKPLVATSRSIAERIRREWLDQGENIRPDTMPVTRLVGVALERAASRETLVDDIRAYAATDLLSYRADAGPSDQGLIDPDSQGGPFSARQAGAFDPLLAWMETRGLPLRTTTGLLPIAQDPLTLDRLAEHARLYDDLGLTLFAHLTATYGSAALALAVMQARLEAGEAFDLSQLDETFRAETWGEDAEASARAHAIRADTVAVAAVLPDLAVPALPETNTV